MLSAHSRNTSHFFYNPSLVSFYCPEIKWESTQKVLVQASLPPERPACFGICAQGKFPGNDPLLVAGVGRRVWASRSFPIQPQALLPESYPPRPLASYNSRPQTSAQISASSGFSEKTRQSEEIKKRCCKSVRLAAVERKRKKKK